MIRRSIAFILVFLFSSTHPGLAQDSAAPTITAFSSDLQAITPDQAESGTQYANLTWTTAGLRPTDQLFLQVFVLDEWHDVRPEVLPANGTLHWAVAHTLDFTPPRFRLVIRDATHNDVNTAELVIPYSTASDPANPPKITWLSVGGAPAPAGQMSVFWEIKNRPARANVHFVQVFNDGRIEKIELPRVHQWINSRGQGMLRPAFGGKTLQIRLEIFDIDTGHVYDQYMLNVPLTSSAQPPAPPMPTATVIAPTASAAQPQIVAFQVN